MHRHIPLDPPDAIDLSNAIQRKALRLDEWLAWIYTLSSCEVIIEPLYIYNENNNPKYAFINICIRRVSDWSSLWSEPVNKKTLPTLKMNTNTLKNKSASHCINELGKIYKMSPIYNQQFAGLLCIYLTKISSNVTEIIWYIFHFPNHPVNEFFFIIFMTDVGSWYVNRLFVKQNTTLKRTT